MVCIVKSFPVRKSADVSRHDFGRCCTDSTGDGETNLNSTQLFSCKVNQSSLYTGYSLSRCDKGVVISGSVVENPSQLRTSDYSFSIEAVTVQELIMRFQMGAHQI